MPWGQWIIRNQLGRRNLTPYQRAELALALKPLVAGQAKERILAAQNNDSAKAARENLPEQGKGRSRDELAKVAGVSGRTIDKVGRIARDAVPELRAAASRGEVSIDADKGSFVVEIAPRAYAVLTREKPASILKGVLAS